MPSRRYVGTGDGSVSIPPTPRTSTDAFGSTGHTRGSPTSDQYASRAVQPKPANSSAEPPSAAAARFGQSRGSSAGCGPSGPWKASESPNTSRVVTR
ncbi:hypothetical protein GCM10010171_40650 [Actinokineospora fastidiosa]|uniref:Uncharacterized protein n=1 Tax=Actinokineospora fastidiosa TaxID=1816 RepID=A0A918LF89_9PSEU|nr:hypothetical protein GCM10010171_40650 [Actinokineospora fastidiosa]